MIFASNLHFEITRGGNEAQTIAHLYLPEDIAYVLHLVVHVTSVHFT